MSAEEQSRVAKPGDVVLPAHAVTDLYAYLDRAAELREAGLVDDGGDVLVEMAGYLRSALDRAGGGSGGA